MELKRCPFCGGNNIMVSNWGLWRCWCMDCLAKSADEIRKKKTQSKHGTGGQMRALYKRTKGKAEHVQDRLYHKDVFCISNRWIRWAKRYLSKANRRADHE